MVISRTRLLKPAGKLQRLLRKLDSDSTPKQVHGLRTSARRLRSFCNALNVGIPKSVVKKLDKIHKRAGGVRDMDVLTGFAASLLPKVEEERLVQLLEYLGARRKKQARKLHHAVKHFRRNLSNELDDASSRMDRTFRDKMALETAAVKAFSLSSQLALPPRLNRTNLHDYRLNVKEVQDILVLAESPSDPRFVEELGEVRDAIGEWHDWEKLAQVAGKLFDEDRKSPLLSGIKGTAKTKYGRAISLAMQLRKTHLWTSGSQ